MRRYLTVLLFAIVLSGCASVTPTSFAEMDKSDDFENPKLPVLPVNVTQFLLTLSVVNCTLEV